MNNCNHKDEETSSDDIEQRFERLERMRRDFVANVSHELRTPLTVFRGYLETLLEEDIASEERYQLMLVQMQQHCQRMERVIEDLLLLSHIEAREQCREEDHCVEVAKIVDGLAAMARSYRSQERHAMTLRVDDDLQLRGNESELKSLFSNLIINAVKYTPADGEIVIEWFQQEDRAIFRVIDTGIGIAAKHLPRLTERFYRVDKARSRDSGGTGLGLAIAKHVLLHHQAELVVDSEEDVGSTFSCVFPPERIWKKEV